LQRSANIVAIHVKYYGKEKAFWMPATPNRTLGKSGVVVFEADLGAAGWLVSNDTWKARKSDAWQHGAPDAGGEIAESIPGEIFDARRFPHGWRDADFDDGGWGNVQVVRAMHTGTYRSQPPTNPYGPMYPRPIAQLDGECHSPNTIRVEHLQSRIDEAIEDPVTRVEQSMSLPVQGTPHAANVPLEFDIPADGIVRLTIDMGRIVFGCIAFEVKAQAGTVLDVSYLEEPYRAGSGFGRMRAGTRYIARGEHDHVTLFDAIGFRYGIVLIHGAPGRVTLRHFEVQEYLYPWQDRATFTCSDPELNRIFEAGLRTVQLCSADAFIDCPTREQRAWVGDGIVHQMVHLATNSDWRLAWRYLTLSDSPRADGILPMTVVSLMELTGAYTLPD